MMITNNNSWNEQVANGDVFGHSGVRSVWRVLLRDGGTRPRRGTTGVLVLETKVERAMAVGRRFGVVWIPSQGRWRTLMYTYIRFYVFLSDGNVLKECAWMVSLWCLLCRARVVIIYKHINLFIILNVMTLLLFSSLLWCCCCCCCYSYYSLSLPSRALTASCGWWLNAFHFHVF